MTNAERLVVCVGGDVAERHDTQGHRELGLKSWAPWTKIHTVGRFYSVTLGTVSKAISANTAWHGPRRLKAGRAHYVIWLMKKKIPTDQIKIHFYLIP